jgi:hypothetical protein
MPAGFCPDAPTISVVMTLLHSQGQALHSIKSWTARQSVPPDQIELIVVSNGKQPCLEGAVRGLLSDRDRLLHLASDNEMELYDFGARQAKAPWLLFTESHVLATENCLAVLLDYLEQTGKDGACVRTLPATERHWVAWVEERMYREDAAVWTQEGDWRKFTKRGFIVRRTAYERVGGLDHRYLRFAETAIAARLHACGYQIGFAPAAVVHHVNTTNLHELLDYVWEYRQQAWKFAQDNPGLLPAGSPAGRVLHPVVRAAMTHAVWNTFGAALKQLHSQSGRRLAGAMLRAGLGQLLERWLGMSADRWRYSIRYWKSRFGLACARGEARFRAFMRVWQNLGDLAEVHYRSGRASLPKLLAPVSPPCQLGDVKAEQLVGFHPREILNGQPFRWTGVVACLALQLAPGSWRLTLETRGLRSVTRDEVRLFVNGAVARPDREWLDGRPSFRIDSCHCADGRPQLLTVTCPPLKGVAKDEVRALGLPLFRIDAERVSGRSRGDRGGGPTPSFALFR